MPPSRKIIGSSFVQSKIVDGILSFVGPSSMTNLTLEITGLDASIIVALGSPEILALVVAKGPIFSNNSKATG